METLLYILGIGCGLAFIILTFSIIKTLKSIREMSIKVSSVAIKIDDQIVDLLTSGKDLMNKSSEVAVVTKKRLEQTEEIFNAATDFKSEVEGLGKIVHKITSNLSETNEKYSGIINGVLQNSQLVMDIIKKWMNRKEKGNHAQKELDSESR